MTTDLQALWHTNRAWRRWMDENTAFVTPDILDCLRYALCESAECLDAWLRQKNQSHARNNVREHTVEQELADTAMLLLTAMPIEFVEEANRPVSERSDIDWIILDISRAVYAFGLPGSSAVWASYAEQALRKIKYYPGFDLATELAECHRRLAMKHGCQFVTGLQLNGEIVPWLAEQEPITHD